MANIYKEPVSRQPEYERLGIEPKTGGSSLLHDEIGEPLVKKHPVPNLPPPEQIANEKVLIKHEDNSEPPKSVNPTVRRHPMVASGLVDQLWSDGVIIDNPNEKIPDGPMIDNNEEIEVAALQGMDPLETTRAKFVICPPENSPKEIPQNLKPQERTYQKLSDLDEGDYAILFKNKLVVVADNVSEIAEESEKLLMKDGVLLEDIAVFQRLRLSFGVIVK